MASIILFSLKDVFCMWIISLRPPYCYVCVLILSHPFSEDHPIFISIMRDIQVDDRSKNFVACILHTFQAIMIISCKLAVTKIMSAIWKFWWRLLNWQKVHFVEIKSETDCKYEFRSIEFRLTLLQLKPSMDFLDMLDDKLIDPSLPRLKSATPDSDGSPLWLPVPPPYLRKPKFNTPSPPDIYPRRLYWNKYLFFFLYYFLWHGIININRWLDPTLQKGRKFRKSKQSSN